MFSSKFAYYTRHALFGLIPAQWQRRFSNQLLATLNEYSVQQQQQIIERVNYYCRLEQTFTPTHESKTSVADFKKTGGNTYYFDLRKVIKSFPSHFEFGYINGDVCHVPDSPCFLKSRPCSDSLSDTQSNQNSVLLKLNAIRHYRWFDDPYPFESKKDQLVWKGAGFRKNRRDFVERFNSHPQCDVTRTDIKRKTDQCCPKQFSGFVSPQQQMQSKFIVSLEGKDVATNLKWIMASNSICMMPKPKFETWFMEGRLIPGVHYIEIKDDYSDVLSKMDYYLANPIEARTIVTNAHQWVAQFKKPKEEYLIELLVAYKYFRLSEQTFTEPNFSRLNLDQVLGL